MKNGEDQTARSGSSMTATPDRNGVNNKEEAQYLSHSCDSHSSWSPEWRL